MATVTRTATGSKSLALAEQRSYSEVVEFLDSHWSKAYNDSQLLTMKALDKALGEPSKKVRTVLVAGTNGKSLTINFCLKLLQSEGIKAGAFYAPHLMNYNERFVINNETISNKIFADLANEVINAAHTYEINASSLEILIMMSLLYFAQNNVDVAFIEMIQGGLTDPSSICNALILVLTRLTGDTIDPKNDDTTLLIKNLLAGVKPGTYVVSGDQSKLNLTIMANYVESQQGIWEMPIRKLAALQYPYEQLHGRCAALAERICCIITRILGKTGILVANSLLAKQKGQRGRPTLEAKRQAELNPKKTLTQFWKEESTSLAGRFQLLDKEKTTILLDNASNIDALENLLLGVRLLHYKKSYKGVALIIGCDKNEMNVEELLRNLRYFTKKHSAHIIFCPINNSIAGLFEESWNMDSVMSNITSMKIKAKAANSLHEALEMAKKIVEERQGLIVITGSQSIIAEYWKNKGVKTILPAR